MSPAQRVLTLWRGRALGMLVLLGCLIWHGFLVDDQSLIQLTQLDIYQQISPREATSTLPVIVAVDERSIATEGQWPWPRTKVAQLIRRIGESGAASIGLDILFLDPDRQSPARAIPDDPDLPQEVRTFLEALPDYDATLADVLGRTYSVLALAGTRQGAGLNGMPARAPIGFSDLAALDHLIRFPGVDRSIEEIAVAAYGRGLVNAVEDPDAIIRRIPVVASVNGQPVPGFAAELLRVAMDADIHVTGDASGIASVRIGDWTVPTLKDGSIYVPFSPPYADRYVSAHDVLTGASDALARLEGAIVMVGLTGQGLVDFPTSPLRDRMPGVEVHAQAIEAMDESNFISRPNWGPMLELGLIVVVGAFFIFAVPRLRALYGAPAVAVTLLFVLAVGLLIYATSQIVIFTVGPALSGVLVGIAMLLTTLQLATAQRRALARTLQLQREERARVQGELDAARDIQFNLLPQPEPVHDDDTRYSLAAMLEPARDVGGDLYDFFLIDEDRLFVAVGDVSGKGLPASLFMAISKALYKSAVLRGIEAIDDITMAANNEISRENPDMLFVTLFAGIIDLNTGVMRYCNAGHEPPLIFAPGDDAVMALEDGGGPPICVMDDFPYMAAEMTFERGQMMLITTDGIAEAMNEAGELYGNDRLYDLLRGLPVDADAGTMRTAIYEDVKGHAGEAPASDDITILGFRWFGPA
ncbi:CHASE2 domain-containing protein [Minwuia sp.]|uniref:CHASE2 domain-containing protein n=1 Tax=Minwuia sp. TaxID=2493630 RepID=UPI003A8EDC78